MLENFQGVFSSTQLNLYLGLFEQQSAILCHHIQSDIARQLVSVNIHGLIAESTSFNWYTILKCRIDASILADYKRLPNEAECALINGFILFLRDVFQNQEKIISKEKHEHANSLCAIQFERMNERIALKKVCQQLKNQLNEKNNSLFVISNQLASERQQVKALKESITADVSRFSDKIYLRQSIINELICTLNKYDEHIADMERTNNQADINANLLRLQLYQMGLDQQRRDSANYMNKLETVVVQQNIHKVLYQYIENIHRQISLEHKTLNEIDLNQLQGQRRMKDDSQLLRECRYTITDFTFACQQRSKSLNIAHERNILANIEEHLRKEKVLKDELYNLSMKISQLKQEITKQEQIIARLNLTITLLKDKEAMAIVNLNQMEGVCNQLRSTLKITEADSKALKAIVKNLESSDGYLIMENSSLQQNLLVMSQSSNRQKQSVEEEFTKQKNTVEQLVEKNHKYKLRNRELEVQLATLRDNYDILRDDFDKDIHEYCLINQNLKYDILSKDDVIDSLRMKIDEKDNHIHQVSEKIQLLEDQLSVLQELNRRNKFLEEMLCENEGKLKAINEKNERYKTDLQTLHIEKSELETQIILLRQTKTNVITKNNHLKHDSDTIVRLNFELDDCHERIRRLEEEVQILSKNVSAINDQNQQLKYKIIRIMEGCINKPAFHKESLNKQPEDRSESLNLNLEETLKNKENVSPLTKEKYTQNIMNLNELINYMMNYAKGYSFSEQYRIREGSWICQQGHAYLKKMQSSTNIQGKIRNYLKVSQIATRDPRVKDVCDTFTTIMESYFVRMNSK